MSNVASLAVGGGRGENGTEEEHEPALGPDPAQRMPRRALSLAGGRTGGVRGRRRAVRAAGLTFVVTN